MIAGFLDFLWQGKPPPSVTSKSSSFTQLPDWFQAYQKGVLQKGNAVAAMPYTPYSGTRIAGFQPEQNQAFKLTKQNVGDWRSPLNQGMDYTQSAAGPFNQGEFDQFMSPYVGGVVNRIAELGQRNLTENLLPGVNDTFTGAGQFGSRRHGEFTNRALRDANESILGQQSLALQQAHDSAMGNYQTAMQRRLAAGDQMGALAQAQQGMGLTDAASLEAIGAQKQGLKQGSLDLAYQDFQTQRDWPKMQTEWMNNMLHGATVPTGTTGSGTGPADTYQPGGLAQLAGMYSLFKGLKRGGKVRRYANGGPMPFRRVDPARTPSIPFRRVDPARIPAGALALRRPAGGALSWEARRG